MDGRHLGSARGIAHLSVDVRDEEADVEPFDGPTAENDKGLCSLCQKAGELEAEAYVEGIINLLGTGAVAPMAAVLYARCSVATVGRGRAASAPTHLSRQNLLNLICLLDLDRYPDRVDAGLDEDLLVGVS